MKRGWTDVRVLVTGARGFLGTNVLARLRSLGATTYAWARQPAAAEDGVRWISGDLSDYATVRSRLEEIRPEIVFHLAGQTIAAPGRELVQPSLRNNLVSTVNLLDALAEWGCRRLVLTGSLEEPSVDRDGGIPVSPYGASKSAEVMYARMFHSLYRLPVVTLRLYMTYGPHQRPTKLIPSLTLALLRGRSPTANQPDRQVDWIYIDDVVEAVVAAGRAAGVDGRTVEVGSGILVPIRKIALELEAIVGGPGRAQYANPQQSIGVHGRSAELEAAKELLQWVPTTSLREGLERTVSWYRSNMSRYPDSGG